MDYHCVHLWSTCPSLVGQRWKSFKIQCPHLVMLYNWRRMNSIVYLYNNLVAQISASKPQSNDFGWAVSLCLLIRNCRFRVVMSQTIFFFNSMVTVHIKPSAPRHTTVLTALVKKNSTTRSFTHVISVRLLKNLPKDGTLAKVDILPYNQNRMKEWSFLHLFHQEPKINIFYLNHWNALYLANCDRHIVLFCLGRTHILADVIHSFIILRGEIVNCMKPNFISNIVHRFCHH